MGIARTFVCELRQLTPPDAFPPFNRKYGHYTGAEHGYQVSAKWQTSLANGAQCGQILGLIGGYQDSCAR